MNNKVAVPGCKGTTVQEIFSNGEIQIMKVDVSPNGEIPLHQHETAATMVIVSGKAETLGKEYKYVKEGDVVVKKSNEPHGFTNIKKPFSFISISYGKGIMHDQGKDWDMRYI